jgi:hypothetical protein
MAQFTTRSGLQISYEDRKKPILEKSFSWLIDSINSGNLLIGFHVSPSLIVLSSSITISGISSDELKASLIFKACVSIYHQKIIVLGDLFEALGDAVIEYQKKPHSEYHLIFPINLKREKIHRLVF